MRAIYCATCGYAIDQHGQECSRCHSHAHRHMPRLLDSAALLIAVAAMGLAGAYVIQILFPG